MGRLRTFPRMSQSAISIPLTTCVVAPREPMYVKARKILFQIRSICEGSSPMRRSLSFSTMPATARLAVRVVVVISPQPVTPSSVCTSMKKYSPQKVPSTFTSQGLIDVILILVSSGRHRMAWSPLQFSLGSARHRMTWFASHFSYPSPSAWKWIAPAVVGVWVCLL